MDIKRLNTAQQAAVVHTEGPLLIIAGAGSGKTSVLCCRIANIINSGLCEPWQVLAVTFTNKAAGELRERLASMNIHGANDIWAGTFHSTCVKILRMGGIEAVGYRKGFTIYDTDDSLRVIKSAMKDLNVDEKSFSAKTIFSSISRAKDKLITPKKFETTNNGKRDYLLENVGAVYESYQNRLKAANALDFDDLIMKTVELFEKNPDILEKWQRRFRYIMIDEYQDTNHAQYRLVSLLTGERGNLCVVGDEDQSIYRFRGATIENILSFEDEFNARTIKLEQNYRSTSYILGAANGVIQKNTQRKPKSLYSTIDGGEKVQLHILQDEQEEAMLIVREVEKGKGNGIPFGANAVLYRTNAQSRIVELTLSRMSIPYRIIGGVRFYDRKEIKDIIAYMSVILNPFDFVRFGRIINEPKRAIGDVTQLEIERVSAEMGISPIDVMANSLQYPSLRSKAAVLEKAASMFNQLTAVSESGDLSELIDEILELSGYNKMLQSEGDEGLTRLENIRELKSAAVRFGEDRVVEVGDGVPFGVPFGVGNALSDFLEQVALVSDTDSYSQGEDKVVLMSIHAAKGLEFGRVFIIGAEEGMFPSFRSLADPMDIEEERRLAYVAITRAKRNLYITAAKQRLLYGVTQRNMVSRFVREIPSEYININEKRSSRNSGVSANTKPLGRGGAGQREIGEKKSGFSVSRNAYADSLRSVVRYSEGEGVKHRVFGEGIVVGVQVMGNDSLLEIAFAEVGTKKIMANFAKIEKL